MKKLKSFFGDFGENLMGNLREEVFLYEYFRSKDMRGDFSKPWISGWRFSGLSNLSGLKPELKTFSIGEIFFTNSKKNVIRGLHYILHPSTQRKIIVCLKGKITDVVVDLRKKSPTYSKYVSLELSEDNNHALYIGEGFAHGFLTLKDSLLLYLVDKPYNAKLDRGIRWNDPKIGINWGIAKPILSERDETHPFLEEAENTFI
ncbi:MAG: dTDP-4-dehydrorhamnose 3,5-epimerase family protein [Candidatus Micrarchaeota archaeon]